MPVASTNPMVNGAAMVWATTSTELEKWRSYLNGGVVVGDFVDAALQRENIYRTEKFGFPLNGSIGQSQQIYRSHQRVQQPIAQAMQEMRGRRERFMIKPKLLPSDELVRTDISRTVRLFGTSIVCLRCQTAYTISHNDQAVDNDPEYPDGAGSARGERAGHLSIWRQLRSTHAPAEFTESVEHCYPSGPQAGGSSSNRMTQTVQMEASASLGAGVWDFYVVWSRGATKLRTLQLDLGVANFKIEVFEQ